MVLQPLLDPNLSQKTPPFFSVFCLSPPSYSQIVFCLLVLSEPSLRFSQRQLIYGVRSAWRPTPNLEDQGISLLVWVITFDLFDTGGPTSSYATAGIAVRILWPHKPHHYVKVKIPLEWIIISNTKRFRLETKKIQWCHLESRTQILWTPS